MPVMRNYLWHKISYFVTLKTTVKYLQENRRCLYCFGGSNMFLALTQACWEIIGTWIQRLVNKQVFQATGITTAVPAQNGKYSKRPSINHTHTHTHTHTNTKLIKFLSGSVRHLSSHC
jgi:hypothetical protein